MELALVLARLAQYLGAAGLFGGALLLARQPIAFETAADRSSERRMLFGSAVVLFAATVAALGLQTAAMAGRADAPALDLVLTTTAFGAAVAVRLVVVAVAIGLIALPSRALRLRPLVGLGALATVTLAWGGHGVADEGAAGWIHLAADLVHLVAAALWTGALAALLVMAFDRRAATHPAAARRLHASLDGFSGMGTLAVALLILSGLVNAGFLIGLNRLGALFTTLYGRLLLAKLALFGLMLALAALNRWRLTSRLAVAGASATPALAALRRSVALETSAAVAVLALVAWLGTLAPPSAA